MPEIAKRDQSPPAIVWIWAVAVPLFGLLHQLVWLPYSVLSALCWVMISIWAYKKFSVFNRG